MSETMTGRGRSLDLSPDRTAALAENLRAARTKVGLTAKDAGAACGLSHSAVSKYEGGGAIPTVAALCLLAAAYKTTAAKLLAGV